ncbi:hypothetical protein MPSEU_000887400 [Mayamaea pseudoterrestris]|nr:hypothetical protein MPSEU_000887400 [Mayamaea pseudoterrestris]
MMIGPNQSRRERDDETAVRRNYWGCARERNRRLARTAIKRRIESDGDISRRSTDTLVVAGKETNADESCNASQLSSEWIDKAIWHIIKGKRSFFSLTCIQENLVYFETPHSSELLFSLDKGELKGKAQMINWFERQGYENFKQEIRNNLDTFTLYEFAVWCRRWHIVGSLIIAAVNPCVRGRRRSDSTIATHEYNDNSFRLFAFGQTILRLFFDMSVPLSLSSHVVQRVAELRRTALVGTCSICFTKDPLLCCDMAKCGGACELCWWKNVVECLERLEDYLVTCPVCCCSSNAAIDNSSVGARDPVTLREESLQKYEALPYDIKELRKRDPKSSGKKPQGPKEEDILVSSWTAAVAPLVGPTMELRRDRFFLRVTKGHFHHIKGFLSLGIDVDMQNEYGQTALYIAAWLGYTQIVQTLLDYGADTSRLAHGGLSALAAAQANERDVIMQMLIDACAIQSVEMFDRADLTACTPQLETLIDLSVDHPGAGSFVIDNAVTDKMIDALKRLWRSIPMEMTCIKQKKGKLCSDRSYYCDAEGFLRRAISQSISDAFGAQVKSAVVLEHMRFLSYAVPGATLLPHTDLHRVELTTGIHSTHTFILYLTSCCSGGETSLLEHTSGPGRHEVRAKVTPIRGRLLLFPHLTPHEGNEVVDVPKLLIRGEVIISYT